MLYRLGTLCRKTNCQVVLGDIGVITQLMSGVNCCETLRQLFLAVMVFALWDSCRCLGLTAQLQVCLIERRQLQCSMDIYVGTAGSATLDAHCG